MKLLRTLFGALLLMVLAGCGESDMRPDYIVKKPRVMAIKITDPEIRRGDPFSLDLLVLGEDISQEMITEVKWRVGLEFDESDGAVGLLGTTPYSETLHMASGFWDTIPSEILDTLLQGQSYLDVPVMAELTVGGVTLRGAKTLRITETPLGKNPVIQSIALQYDQGEETITAWGQRKIIFKRSAHVPETIACTAIMETLAPGENDKLLFRWSVSTSKTNESELYVSSSQSDIEALLGEGEKAAEYRQSVLFSTRGEEGDGPIQYGEYEVALVVRDKKTDSSGRQEDRFGTDFMTFTIAILDQ